MPKKSGDSHTTDIRSVRYNKAAAALRNAQTQTNLVTRLQFLFWDRERETKRNAGKKFPLCQFVPFQVLRVRAVDGDRSIGNPVVYSIVSGPGDIFAINSDTGVVYTQAYLDRESPR